MEQNIQIIEKPDWVSWDEIHDVLWAAHKENRQKGINMRLPTMTGEELRKFIEGRGKMFVAMDGERVIGTLAFIVKEGNKWYNRGRYCYSCLGSVLPESNSKGVFRALMKSIVDAAEESGLNVFIHDTNENNARIQRIIAQRGHVLVGYKACNDHYNKIYAKWLNKCPYPTWYIKFRALLSKLYVKTRYKMVPGKGKVKRFGI